MTVPKVIYRMFFSALVLAAFSSVAAAAQKESEFLSGRGMPYAAFDALPHSDIKVAGATLHVGIAPGELALSSEQLQSWVRHSADVVASFYGRFPVASARILIVPVDGSGVRGGTTWAYRGAAIRLLVGSKATLADLTQDWMIVHEMVHLALPDLEQRYNWLSEGLATYVEPIARAQVGDLTDESIWAAMVRDMPKGLPKDDDRGLDNTPTWGRTYWGGAMFCLLADVEIRKQSKNRLGLRDAMRGVLAAGGNHEADWPIEQVFSVADKTLGFDVLTPLHAKLGAQPVAPDLDQLWRDLGIKLQPGGAVAFDDSAPLAKIRMAITRRQDKSRTP